MLLYINDGKAYNCIVNLIADNMNQIHLPLVTPPATFVVCKLLMFAGGIIDYKRL
jgi:hypothetical protein